MAIPKIEAYTPPTQVQLNRRPLGWTLQPERAALLIHDMQNYFLAPYASPAFVDDLITRIAVLRERCHRLGIPVYYTAQPGDQDVRDRALLVDFWGAGMPAQGDGQAIVAGLAPVAGRDQVLVKHRYSAFAKSDLLARLQAQGRDQLIVTGIYAHIGCLVTATDAFMSDIQPFVVADALGDFSLEQHQMALRHMAHCSSQVLSSQQVLQQLGGQA